MCIFIKVPLMFHGLLIVHFNFNLIEILITMKVETTKSINYID